LYDEKKVKEDFGFGPEMMVDYKALRGDASDNIPGVRGIGEKTATELIQKIGGIDDIYKEIRNKEIGNKFKESVIKKLVDGKKDAEMSRELAQICTEVDGLDFDFKKCEAHTFDAEKIGELLKKFEFFSLLKRIPGANFGNKLQATSYRLQKSEKSKIKNVISDKDVEKLIGEIEKAKILPVKKF